MTPANELFAFDLCKPYPLPDNRVLVHNPRNGRKSVLTPDVYAALMECQVFRNTDDHIARIASKIPALRGQEESIRKVLESVRNDGHMISSEIYSILLQPPARTVSFSDKPVAAIITWERPEALARCLESLRENCDLKGLDRLYVIDDSRTAEIIKKNRNTTESFAVHAPIRVVYMGAVTQRQFMEDIIGQIPDQEEAVMFLLDRERWASLWSSGLGRTVALLLSVGERLIVLDDDILCEVYETRTGNSPRFANPPREATFYSDNSQWQETRAEVDTDPLARHARFVGGTLGNALAESGIRSLAHGSFAGARVDFLENLTADSPVLVTECGSLGDPGSPTSNWLTGLEGASLARLLDSAETVETALNIRNCWTGRSRPQFVPHALISQLTGLDNRQCLPPYTPILRGEDQLFGEMVGFMFPSSVVFDQPWAVPHLPIPPRTWARGNTRYRSTKPFPTFFLSMVSDNGAECHARDPLKRLEHVASLMQDMADRDHDALVAHYHDYFLDSQAFSYSRLKKLRAQSDGAPQAWIDYLDDGIARLDTEIVAQFKDRELTGYPKHLKGEMLTAFWQNYWNDFATAMKAWPEIRMAARNCRT